MNYENTLLLAIGVGDQVCSSSHQVIDAEVLQNVLSHYSGKMSRRSEEPNIRAGHRAPVDVAGAQGCGRVLQPQEALSSKDRREKIDPP